MEVEVVAAIRDRGGAGVRGLAGGEKRHARGHGEGLLAAGEQHVDAERVKVHRHRGEAGHGVHDEHDVRELLLQLGDVLDRIEHAGGGLAVDEGDRVELARGELLLAPGSARMGWPHSTLSSSACLPQRLETSNHLSEKAPQQQLSTFFFTRLRIEPSMMPQADEVLMIHLLRRAEERLQLRLDLRVEILEALAPVADHRRGHRFVGVRRDFDGAGNEQFDVIAHRGRESLGGSDGRGKGR